jgi:hypothetical protein
MPFTPHDAATHAIGRARKLVDEASRHRKVIPLAVRADMRRLGVVMAVAALDTYMHRLILERAYKQPDNKLPRALAKLGLPFEQVLGWADEAGAAARRPPHDSRPRVALKRQLRDRLLRETYQRFDDVSKALGMAGLAGKWDQIGAKLSPPMTPPEIRVRLDAVVTRRNQIVHEGDYRRLERPATLVATCSTRPRREQTSTSWRNSSTRSTE